MASNPFRKLLTGDRISGIPKEAWNSFIDEARGYKPGRPQNVTRFTRGTPIIKVKNTSGSTLDRWSIVGLDVPVILPTANEVEFLRYLALKVVTPTTASHTAKFGVLLQPLANNKIGEAVIDGPVICRVTGAAQTHAEVTNSDSNKLTMSATGSARVLWAESGSSERWAVVRLGDPASSASAGGFARQTFSNANHGVTGTADTFVSQIGTMSAARTVTLPAATARSGMVVIVIDESGTVTATNKINVQRAGSDTINGATTALVIASSRGHVFLESDGTSNWTLVSSSAAVFSGVYLTATAVAEGPIAWETSTSDPDNYWDAGTPDAVTIPADGWYSVTANIDINSGSDLTYKVDFEILIGGVRVAGHRFETFSAQLNFLSASVGPLPLTAGQTVAVSVNSTASPATDTIDANLSVVRHTLGT